MNASVRLSVRLSVCLSVRPSVTPFSTCSHQRIIIKLSGPIALAKSDVHAKGQGQRSRSQRSNQIWAIFDGFRMITQVVVHG